MIGVDTNVLVRVLVDDVSAPEQCKKARALLIQQDTVFIHTVVLIETIWVLQRAYSVNKEQILVLLNQLLLQKTLIFESRPLVETALNMYRADNFEFSDALILASHDVKQCQLYTFDKKLGKHSLATDLNKITL